MKEFVVSTNERDFIFEGLKHSVRVDGRTPMDIRVAKVHFGHKTGTVTVQLGRSRATACVTADIVAPYPDRPAQGFLNFFVNFSPMAALEFNDKRPSDKSVELSRVVERGIKDSRAIDTEALCIIAKEKVWSVRVDVHVTDHGGNLTDCVNLAAVTALLHFRRPDVTVAGNLVKVHSIDDRQPVPLAVHHIPVSVTFAFYKIENKEYVILDPSLKEESVAEGILTLTMNKHKEICCIQKSGGLAMSFEQINRCTKVAAQKAQQLTALINKRLEEDSQTERSNLKLAGMEDYINAKGPTPVGQGKDELGNPLSEKALAMEEGEVDDSSDEEGGPQEMVEDLPMTE